jgi:hypothetical protein
VPPQCAKTPHKECHMINDNILHLPQLKKTPKKLRKKPAKVLFFNGVTTLDHPADRIIEQALGKLDYVLILGFDKDGGEYFASNKSDGADALYVMERAKHKLMKIVDGN